MASRPSAAPASAKSPFHTQRDALVADIALALEHVLQNMNKLNRSLEGVIAVGNEFGAVEALWSQFEGVMAQPPAAQDGAEKKEQGEDGEEADGEDEDEEVRNGEGGDEALAREGRASRRGR